MKLSNDRTKLALSLSFNGLSKLPAILVITSILPQIKESLGLHDYNSLLAALAFGIFFTLPFGGVNVVARRLVGAQFGRGDQGGQADAFVGAVAITSALMTIACVLSLILSRTVFSSSMSHIAALAALVPIISAGLNLSDNIRAAFNEHYVTAALLFAFQLIIYVPVIILHPAISGMFMAALIMQAPLLLTSTVQVSLLLIKRSYLLRGTFKAIPEILRGSLLFSIGEGAISGASSASVFFLSSYGTASEGAWYGTFVRLFQSVISPLLLFMFPLSAFVATKWPRITAQKRRLLITLSLVFAVLYGSVGAAALAIGGPIFLQRLYHIMPIGSHLQVAAISIFFMGIMSEKAYGLVIYSIDHGRYLSFMTFVAVFIAALVAGLSAIWSTPLQTVSIFGFVGGLCLLAVMLGDALKRRGGESRPAADHAQL